MPEVIGASLAGTSAALELLALGHEVTLFDKSKFPRHKVCGEFLDAQAAPWLLALGDLRYEFIHRVSLIWPSARKDFTLPRPAFGISRYQLDAALLNSAIRQGARFVNEARSPNEKAILAHGRKGSQLKGGRQFGYKAHIRGRQNDAVELYFHASGYTGVNPIEDGLTNVCGLASEADLKQHNWNALEFLLSQPHLAPRLQGCQLAMDWHFTGPLAYGEAAAALGYAAGDALNFTDPFTGSGMLCALLSGRLAARSLHEGITPSEHLRKARGLLGSPYSISRLLRRALQWPVTPHVVQLVPGRMLYHLSRPRFET
jgi:flavin-dependent dehydrogenase